MGKARTVDHQPLEETFTDINILELKTRHSTEIHSRLFSKHEEGKNGADWEWWLTDSKKSVWLGLRVQAKVLQLKSDTFPHLHYKSGKSKTYQSAKLKKECAKEGLIPLYALYVYQDLISPMGPLMCRSFAHAPELYGCSLITLSQVETLQVNSKTDRLSVMSKALPWHCLVCCSGFGGYDLPTRAWRLLQAELGVDAAPKSKRKKVQSKEGAFIGPRTHPPEYVLDILADRPIDLSPTHARGVLVIQGREDG